MNKLYKCALGLLTAFILSFACFSSAVNIPTENWGGNIMYNGLYDYIGDIIEPSGTTQIDIDYTNIDFVCFKRTNPNNGGQYSLDGQTWYNAFNGEIGCVSTTSETLYIRNGSIQFMYFIVGEGYIPSQYNSLQCQTEYNLIPINEVTANYCKLNFDLIDPMECPINSGTGTIVRSNLMINDIPYAQNQNINVFIPDFLAWNIAFNDFNTVIEVEGYNADEEYIENVINQEKLTPTNKDIEDMLTGFMTNYFPYLALAIVFLYLARKIFKLFK